MTDIERERIEQEARRRAGAGGPPTRYGEVVNRYLGVAGYTATAPHRITPAAHPTGSAPPAVPPTVPPSARTVVVGVDDSPASFVAVDHAAIEAELRGWDLRLLHVQHGGGSARRDRGAALLTEFTDRVHARSRTVAVAGRLVVGAPATTLLAEAHGAGLVVVGSRHGAVGAAFGRTVGARIAADHDGPVLVVRVPGWPPGPEFASRPVVVGVDDSPDSTPAVEFALAEARARECDVVMLHATGEAPAADEPAGRLADADGVRVHHRRVPGTAVAALVAASDRAAAVVLGRRGRGSRAGAAPLGSVSRALVQRAHCPVFLVG
ncbi:universal stress protein [Spirilliplanes yamanashiensis]|uniref:UspA domain-containing protein n=1 Tax=Spirilliplanes yamanashiensis TaxID=42233 RepID=A0A8J3YFI5_9ACTN|nr:universal stress protein [Spirilliplanes yamanashiensis]MDP9818244.1 nucleotide-binding universal stress UspA family protein [Spirilliplanes yamanashiensis]GIJ06728.1 hypothetical protein Sya03_60800 [Spirilliplanes yamanashiensis]